MYTWRPIADALLKEGIHLRIGLFTDTYFPQINGVSTSVRTISNALRQRGHTVYIFAPSAPRGEKLDDNVIAMPSMPCFFFKSLRNRRMGLVYPPKALGKIAMLKLDVVHTQTEFSLGSFGRILAKTFHLPVVHTYHTMYVDYVHYVANGALISKPMAKDFSRFFCNSANAVIAPTGKVKNSLLQYGVERPIEIIPTGVDTEKFKSENYDVSELYEIKKSLGLSSEDKVILSLGRLGKEKNIDAVIKSMPRLLELCPKAKLLIVGDGPMWDELISLTQSLDVKDSVIFAGARPWEEIGKYYQLGDVFVSASTSETQGLTFNESMAAGVPVVAKFDESIEDIIKDGETGLLFRDDSEIAETISRLFSNEGLREKLSRNGREEMEELSVSRFADRVERLYEDVLENPAKYSFNPDHSLSPVFVGKRTAGTIMMLPGIIKKNLKRRQRRAAGLYKISIDKIGKFYNHRIHHKDDQED